MTTVYIVRHCEAYGNKARIFQGTTDCDITETGARQLESLAERFRTVPLDKVYTSPLIRAKKTAEAMNRYHAAPLVVEPGIIEIDGGEIEGISWVDFPKTKPVLEYNWSVEPHKFAPRGGESMKELYARVSKTLQRLVEENKGKTVALATHGCVIRNMMCYASGRPVEQLKEVKWADNTGVFLLQYEGDGLPEIKLFNDFSHLPEDCLPNASRIGHVEVK